MKRNDEPSSPITFKVSEIRAHPQFSRVGFYNDIAVLVLDKPARKSKYVIPLCLPPPELRNEKFAGRKTTVVGWGTTFYGGKESTVQRQAVLPIWRNEDCNQAYFQPITDNFICAGYSEGGTDACQVGQNFNLSHTGYSFPNFFLILTRFIFVQIKYIRLLQFIISITWNILFEPFCTPTVFLHCNNILTRSHSCTTLYLPRCCVEISLYYMLPNLD